MIQLTAFLGNFGAEYAKTRHNAAWLFLERLPFAAGLSWQEKYKAQFASMDADEFAARCGIPESALSDAPRRLCFMKPETYMNLSGEAVGEAASFLKIKSENILIVHDEIELPLGTVSLKWSGGLGGHNGLRSIRQRLGTADFWRLRFGVGKCRDGDVAGYVLSAFRKEELPALDKVFDAAKELFPRVVLSKEPSVFIPEWGKKKVCPSPVLP